MCWFFTRIFSGQLFYFYPKNSCCTSCSTFLNDMEYIAKMIKLRVHVATMRVGTDIETILLGLLKMIYRIPTCAKFNS